MSKHLWTVLYFCIFLHYSRGSPNILETTINRGSSFLSSVFSIETIRKAFNLIAATSNHVVEKYPSCEVKDGDLFDFIIVGGGTAGLVVANRLTEVKRWRVAVLEAGHDPSFLTVLAGLFPLLTHSSQDWDYYSEDDGVTSQHLNGRRIAYTKGKMLGGSSSLDHAIYERGTSYDFDEWVTLGNEGWDWDTVLKYYKKSEKLLDRQILNGPTAKYHSTKGLLSVSKQTNDPQFQEIEEELLKIFRDIGIQTIPEVNIPKPNGTATLQVKITDKGARASTAVEYLLPVKHRKNLCIVKNALATQIIIDQRKVAKGVKVSISKKAEINIYAKKEVIVCAGVFNSAQLLMLSGIGPKQDLNKYNITVMVDLPVGTNFQDHIAVPIVHSGKKSVITTLETITSIINSGTLPLPIVDGTFSLDQEVPNLQHITAIFGASSPLFLYLMHVSFNLELNFVLSHLLQHPKRELIFSFVINAKPKSRGRVTLQSKNPRVPPLIYTGFFNEKEDLDTIINAIRKINTVQNTTYFKNSGGTFSRPPLPGCDKKKFDSNEYWECYVKVLAGTVFHPVGTCAMGIVTDNQLNVKGISNLRVIDESIMPTEPCGKTGPVVIMIAERAVAFIKEKYNKG